MFLRIVLTLFIFFLQTANTMTTKSWTLPNSKCLRDFVEYHNLFGVVLVTPKKSHSKDDELDIVK